MAKYEIKITISETRFPFSDTTWRTLVPIESNYEKDYIVKKSLELIRNLFDKK